MKGLATLAISIGMMLLLAGAANGATQSHPKITPLCHLPAHARRRLADEYIQVYEVKETEIYVCAYGYRNAYRLSTPYVCPSSFCERALPHLTIAGPFVAYEPEHQATSNIVVRNIVTGRVLYRVSTATPANSDFHAGTIVLKTDG